MGSSDVNPCSQVFKLPTLVPDNQVARTSHDQDFCLPSLQVGVVRSSVGKSYVPFRTGCDVQSGLSKAHHIASTLWGDARHLKSDAGQNREKLCG